MLGADDAHSTRSAPGLDAMVEAPCFCDAAAAQIMSTAERGGITVNMMSWTSQA